MFGFVKADREKYPSTFLRKVVVSFKYPFVNNLKERYDEICDIFKVDFPRTNIVKNQDFEISITEKQGEASFRTIQGNDVIYFKSEDGRSELIIHCENLTISIEGNKYNSFESDILKIINKISNLFSLLNINNIKDCSIRKINLVEFVYNENLSPNGILNFLLTPSSIIFLDDKDKFVTQNIHNLELKDGDYHLSLKYGMNTLPIPEKKIGQLLVDTTITSDKSIDSNQIIAEMELLNGELFNVFSWIFNENAKEALKNGQSK